MKVGIFYNSFKAAPNKIALMDSFKLGVINAGDSTVDYRHKELIGNIDAGFILGYSNQNNYRKSLIETLEYKKIPIIFVDSNVFVYGKENTYYYHRYSVNGVFPNTGEYFLGREFSKTRTEQILNYHNLSLKPWRKKGDHILVLGQRTMSWNFNQTNGIDWIINIIPKIQRYTDRPIVVRLHPGDTTKNVENEQKISNIFNNGIKVSKNENIKEDLQNAWCSIGYNSTPNCVSALEGVPVYLDAPELSWAKDIAFTNMAFIENPPIFDRESWIDKLASIHWNDDEMKTGDYWRQFKTFYRSL